MTAGRPRCFERWQGPSQRYCQEIAGGNHRESHDIGGAVEYFLYWIFIVNNFEKLGQKKSFLEIQYLKIPQLGLITPYQKTRTQNTRTEFYLWTLWKPFGNLAVCLRGEKAKQHGNQRADHFLVRLFRVKKNKRFVNIPMGNCFVSHSAFYYLGNKYIPRHKVLYQNYGQNLN